MIDRTHDPALRSWVESANQPGCDFPIQNLPFATFLSDAGTRVGVAIGDQVLDVTAALPIPKMRSVMALPKARRVELRQHISHLLSEVPAAAAHLVPMSEVELLLPCDIGDYSDFYASIHHATNVGSMFRPDNPLLPNYKWLPVGYHGRASSIVVSGTPVRRPWGQTSEHPGGPPSFAPSRRLDYELELGAFLGPGNAMGEPIPISQAGNHIVGICLLNDWSARDIQTWEYQPLGPFLAKSFATSISPWLVSLDALEPYRVANRVLDPEPLPHLRVRGNYAYDISLEILLQTQNMREQDIAPAVISKTNFREMYWNVAQQFAHMTSNGSRVRAGDLFGTGTISGHDPGTYGSLIELSWRGANPIALPSGETRTFLEDGDTITLHGCAGSGPTRIDFGEVRGTITA